MQSVFIRCSLFTLCKFTVHWIYNSIRPSGPTQPFIYYLLKSRLWQRVMNFHYVIPYWTHDKSDRILGECLMMPFNALKKMTELGYSGRYMNTQIKMSLLNAYRWRRERIRPRPQRQDPVAVSAHISPGLFYFSLFGGLETDSGDRRHFNPLLSGYRYIGYDAIHMNLLVRLNPNRYVSCNVRSSMVVLKI